MSLKRKKICCFIQHKQHVSKLHAIAERLKDDCEITVLIDRNYYLDPVPHCFDNMRVLELRSVYPLSVKYPSYIAPNHSESWMVRQLYRLIIVKQKMRPVINWLNARWPFNQNPKKLSVNPADLSMYARFVYIVSAFLSISFGLLFSGLRSLVKQMLPRRRTMRGFFIDVTYAAGFGTQMRLFSKIMDPEHFDALMMAEANVQYCSEGYIQYCRSRQIATMIMPYTFCSPSEPARAYRDSVLHQVRWFHALFLNQKWFYKYQDKRLNRMPFFQAWSMQRLKLDPPDPWVQESCSADVICAESVMIQSHYQKLGIPANQIKTIGDIHHDMMYDTITDTMLKQEVCEELAFQKEGLCIVFAVYPNYFSMYPTGCEHFSYFDSIRFVIDELLSIRHAHIILALHPTLQKAKYEHLESNRVRISARPTSQLVVICDLYVASVSATIKWAITLGKPVINYDLYQFRYGDYLNVPGVIHVEKIHEFQEVIKNMTCSERVLSDLSEKQRSAKSEWGNIDGQFIVRLGALIEELVETAP